MLTHDKKTIVGFLVETPKYFYGKKEKHISEVLIRI
jgi:hypothetical protein